MRVSLNRKLTTTIPESLMKELDALLYSEFQGRIPKGAYQEFLSARIREYLDWRKFSLEPYGMPQGYYITGPREMVEKLEEVLNAKTNIGC